MMTLFSNKCFFMMKSICLSLWLWNYIPVWFMPFALDMAYLKLFLFLVKLHLILHSFFYQLLVFKNALNSTYNPCRCFPTFRRINIILYHIPNWNLPCLGLLLRAGELSCLMPFIVFFLFGGWRLFFLMLRKWIFLLPLLVDHCIFFFIPDTWGLTIKFLCSPQEFLVKEGDRIELMAMLGLFGAIVSACQMYPYR